MKVRPLGALQPHGHKYTRVYLILAWSAFHIDENLPTQDTATLVLYGKINIKIWMCWLAWLILHTG